MMGKKAKFPAAPRHLSTASRAWWRAIVTGFELPEHALQLLTAAGEQWDRAVQAREVLDREGLTYTDRFGQPAKRPEVSIQREATIAFARLVRELCLDLE